MRVTGLEREHVKRPIPIDSRHLSTPSSLFGLLMKVSGETRTNWPNNCSDDVMAEGFIAFLSEGEDTMDISRDPWWFEDSCAGGKPVREKRKS